MAKFVTKSVYTFTDELTGEPVEQTEEPTTFKIKLVGDSATYEKIMSKENEERFTAWLKSDSASLAGDYQGQIEELERKIEELRSAPATTSVTKTRKPRTPTPGTAKTVVEKYLSPVSYKVVRSDAREAGLDVPEGAKGTPTPDQFKAHAKKHLTAEQFAEITA